MQAIGQTTKGSVSVLTKISLPKPVAQGRDLLVRVKAVSVNPSDTKRRKLVPGGNPSEVLDPPLVLGYDAAGVVEQVGEKVERFQVGDEVFYAGVAGISGRHGSNAQLQLVDERIVGKKPASLSWEDAASLPLTSLTAWEALVEGCRIPLRTATSPKPTKSVLIINAGGGVGSIATQIASKLLDVENVIVTASRPETRAWALRNGATHVINHREPLAPQLAAEGLVFHHAFITTDTDAYVKPLADLIQPFGIIASCDSNKKPLDLNASHMMKAIGFKWVMMYAKAVHSVDMETQGQALDVVSQAVDRGLIQSTATKKVPFTLENLRAMHLEVESGGMIGKVVLTVPDVWDEV